MLIYANSFLIPVLMFIVRQWPLEVTVAKKEVRWLRVTSDEVHRMSELMWRFKPKFVCSVKHKQVGFTGTDTGSQGGGYILKLKT